MASIFPFGWLHYFEGGLLIGCGVAWLFLLTGHIGGMSTVFSAVWSWASSASYFQQTRFTSSRAWRVIYALGLIFGAALWWFSLGKQSPMSSGLPVWQLLLGGFLVGYGSRLSNGCTSGHGICGLGSLQWPSLLAVLCFMATGFLTANIFGLLR